MQASCLAEARTCTRDSLEISGLAISLEICSSCSCPSLLSMASLDAHAGAALLNVTIEVTIIATKPP